MRPEFDDLQRFYATRQGQVARRLIHHQIKALWPDLTGLNVLGYGHAAPFLAGLDTAARAVALAPAEHGLSAAGLEGGGRTALTREDELPLADGSVDRVLLVHALECCGNVPRLLRELWRVLADGGRMIVVVPNRRGLWALSDRTPFGHGQPYSVGQLERTLASQLFTPLADRSALFLPPTGSRLLLRLAVPAERLGLGFARRFAGVVLIEAEKQIYVGTALPALAAGRSRRYVPVMQGLAAARDVVAEPAPPSRRSGGAVIRLDTRRPARRLPAP